MIRGRQSLALCVVGAMLSGCLTPYRLSAVQVPTNAAICLAGIDVRLNQKYWVPAGEATPPPNPCVGDTCARLVAAALPARLRDCALGNRAEQYPVTLRVEATAAEGVSFLSLLALLTLFTVPAYDTIDGTLQVSVYHDGEKVAGWSDNISELIWAMGGVVPMMSMVAVRSREELRAFEDTAVLQRIADSIAAHAGAFESVYTLLHRRADPPELRATAKLLGLRDGKLDGGATATVEVLVEQTNGQAPTSVSISAQGADLTATPTEVRGLAKGSAATASLQVRAAEDAEDAVQRLTITVDPHQAGASRQVQLDLPVRARLPHVGAVLTELNDSHSGNAFGNANGRIDPKETVELTFVVYNDGAGPAHDTRLTALSSDPDLEVMDAAPTVIGELQPGETRKVTLTVALKPHFAARALPYRLSLTTRPQKASRQIEPRLALGVSPQFELVPRMETAVRQSVQSDAAPAVAGGALKGLPPQLEIRDPVLEEPNNNKALDAGEQGALVVKIRNTGRGPARGVVVEAQLAQPGLTLKANTNVPTDIAPGGETTVRIPVVADEERTQDALASATLTVREPHGYDSDPAQFQWQTHALAAPELKVAFEKFDDSETETSRTKGNGDRKFNGGESVELTFGVANAGRGPARNVVATLRRDDDDATVSVEDERQELGTLARGQAKHVSFVVSIPKLKRNADVRVHLEIAEDRPRFSVRHDESLPVGETVRTVKSFRQVSAVGGGETSAETFEVVGDPVETPAKAADQGKPGAIALVVGIEKYQSDLSVATFAEDDAKLVAQYFNKTFHVQPERIHTLLGSYATRSGIEAELNWLKENANPGAPVFFYYSGHGSPETEGATEGTAYLLPWDGRPSDLTHTALTRDGVLQRLAAIESSEIYTFLDACYSSSGKGRSVVPPNTRPLILPKFATPKSARMAVFGAAGADQTAGAFTDKAHGLFTYFLLNALHGAADANRDGVLQLSEIRDYVGREVARTAKTKEGRAQVPQLEGGKPDAVVLRIGALGK